MSQGPCSGGTKVIDTLGLIAHAPILDVTGTPNLPLEPSGYALQYLSGLPIRSARFSVPLITLLLAWRRGRKVFSRYTLRRWTTRSACNEPVPGAFRDLSIVWVPFAA